MVLKIRKKKKVRKTSLVKKKVLKKTIHSKKKKTNLKKKNLKKQVRKKVLHRKKPVIKKTKKILNECLDSSIYQIFPYASVKYDDEKSYEEVKESCQNLNTRLLKLKKINKSLDNFVNNSTQLNWEELQNMNFELSSNAD